MGNSNRTTPHLRITSHPLSDLKETKPQWYRFHLLYTQSDTGHLRLKSTEVHGGPITAFGSDVEGIE